MRCDCYKVGSYCCAPFFHVPSTIQQELKSFSTESSPFRPLCCCRKYSASCSILGNECSAVCTMAARLMATVVFLKGMLMASFSSETLICISPTCCQNVAKAKVPLTFLTAAGPVNGNGKWLCCWSVFWGGIWIRHSKDDT